MAPIRHMTGHLKVLFVHNGLGPGGAERSLAELLASLPAYDVTSVVACLYQRAEGVQAEVQRQGIDLRFLPNGAVARVRALRRLVAAECPDLIHTTIYQADVAGRLAAAGGPPVLSSLVGLSYEPVRLAVDPNVHRLGLLAARALDGWTARRLTSHFHAISQTVKQSAVRALGIDPNRVTVIERGRDPGRLGSPGPERRRRARGALGLDDGAEVIVNVARRDYPKGQRHLLEAVHRLLSTRPRLIALIAGRTGHASPELARLHDRLRLGDRVRFLGHRDDVPELLAAADVFAFPSLFEGLGGALIEAMAMGLPIVASDLPVFREVVEPGRNATLVPPGAAAPLAEALATMLDDRAERRAYGARSRTIFERRFTAERSTERMVALYERLAGAITRERV